MAVKTTGEINQVFAQAAANAAVDSTFRQNLQDNHIRALAAPPYSMTLNDWMTAYDDPNLNATGPWLGGH